MNHCGIKQTSFVGREEIRAAAGRSMEKKETVVYPKPRRLGLCHTSLDPTYARPLRWYVSHQQEDCDSKAGNELLDIILGKGGLGSEQSVTPFFSGSPPSRVSNPLIQDVRFVDEKRASPTPSGLVSSPSTRKGGCVRSNFGNNPAIRIEGFDCLDRDRHNCSIPAWA